MNKYQKIKKNENNIKLKSKINMKNKIIVGVKERRKKRMMRNRWRLI